jgi:hypothetical protein
MGKWARWRARQAREARKLATAYGAVYPELPQTAGESDTAYLSRIFRERFDPETGKFRPAAPSVPVEPPPGKVS